MWYHNWLPLRSKVLPRRPYFRQPDTQHQHSLVTSRTARVRQHEQFVSVLPAAFHLILLLNRTIPVKAPSHVLRQQLDNSTRGNCVSHRGNNSQATCCCRPATVLADLLSDHPVTPRRGQHFATLIVYLCCWKCDSTKCKCVPRASIKQ